MNASPSGSRSEPLQLSDEAKETIRAAAREKEKHGHRIVGTQHLLMALLTSPVSHKRRFRRPKPNKDSVARMVLVSCGLSAESVEAATKDGLITPQDYHLDDPLTKLNAQLAALAELLIARGIFTRFEYVNLLEQNAGSVTPSTYLLPLIDALVEKGKIAQDEKSTLAAKRHPMLP